MKLILLLAVALLMGCESFPKAVLVPGETPGSYTQGEPGFTRANDKTKIQMNLVDYSPGHMLVRVEWTNLGDSDFLVDPRLITASLVPGAYDFATEQADKARAAKALSAKPVFPESDPGPVPPNPTTAPSVISVTALDPEILLDQAKTNLKNEDSLYAANRAANLIAMDLEVAAQLSGDPNAGAKVEKLKSDQDLADLNHASARANLQERINSVSLKFLRKNTLGPGK